MALLAGLALPVAYRALCRADRRLAYFAHPLMAINGVVFDRFNFWDRYTIAYQQLTTLNQDVLYTLPKSVFWMAMFHGTMGLGILRAKNKPESLNDNR